MSIIFGIGINLLSLILLVITLFLLFKVKRKIHEKINLVFIYFIAAFAILIIFTGLGILNELDFISSFGYEESLVAISSFFFFLAFVHFYALLKREIRDFAKEKTMKSIKKFQDKFKTDVNVSNTRVVDGYLDLTRNESQLSS